MNKEIEALLVERAGYVMRKKADRVKAVDEVLREFGYSPKKSDMPEIETATIEPDAERAMRKVAPKRKA
jgi:hypothetical protein